MKIFDIIRDKKKALLIGIGGGGDIIGTIPTRNFLKRFGIDTILAGLTWERKSLDPKPGPRRISEIVNAERIGDCLAFASKDTKTYYNVRFTESVVAEIFNEKILLIDINEGSKKVSSELNKFIRENNIDIVFGIDVGGDVLALGDEKGIRSPLADSIMLCVLKNLDNSILGVIGLGNDGELRFYEIIRNLAQIIKDRGFLGCIGIDYEDIKIMDKIAGKTITEASKLVIDAARGVFGAFKIRNKTRNVFLTPFSLITFYFDPKIVFCHSKIAKLVENKTLKEADHLLRKNGYYTELYFEESYNESYNV